MSLAPTRPGGPDKWLLAGLIALLAYRLAVLASANLPLAPDEAQYFGWSRDLDWGYYSKPPVVALLIRWSTTLFGDSEFGVRALALCLYPAAALAVFGAAQRLYDRDIARWAALVFATLPVVSFGSLFATTDAPLLFFWALALWCLVRALQTDAWTDWLALGLAIGLGLQAKYTMLAFPASAVLYLLWPGTGQWRRLRSPRPWAAALLALAILSPNLWWNAAHDFPTLRHTAEITQLDRQLFHPAAGASFLAAQWAIFGLLFAPVLMLVPFSLRRLQQDDALRLLTCITFLLLAVVTLQAFLARAHANWASPAFVAGSILVVALLVHRSRRRLLAWGLALNVALMFVLHHHADVMAAIGRPLTLKQDIHARQRGWPEFAAALRPYLAAHPDAALLVTNRLVAAELTYYLRDQAPRIAAWNPSGRITDHYRLMQDIRRVPARRYLAVITDPAGLPAAFASAMPLGSVRFVGRSPQDYPLLLLEDFKGYPP